MILKSRSFISLKQLEQSTKVDKEIGNLQSNDEEVDLKMKLNLDIVAQEGKNKNEQQHFDQRWLEEMLYLSKSKK